MAFRSLFTSRKSNRPRFFLLFGLMTCLSIAVLFAFGHRLRHLGHEHLVKERAAHLMTDLIGALSDAETGQRGYLISHDERYLAPYKNAINDVSADISSLWQLGAPDLSVIEEQSKIKLDELRETIELEQQGRHDDAIKLLRTGRGRNTMDVLRQLTMQAEASLDKDGMSLQEQGDTLQKCRVATYIIILLLTFAMLRWASRCMDAEIEKRDVAIIKAKQLEAELRHDSDQRRFFLNAISHDLRSPLNAARLSAKGAQMVLQRLGAEGVGDAIEAMESIDASMSSAKEMLNRLLEIARAGNDESQKRIDTFSLSAMINVLLKGFSSQADQRNLYLRAKIPGEFNIKADRGMVERVLTNLIDNALKYTREGGVQIEVRSSGPSVSVLVSDTGIGIAEAEQERLFDEFYQVGNYERSQSKGFGLGLAISRELARQCGGNVVLETSSPGKGSTFNFTVPSGIEPDDKREEGAGSGGRQAVCQSPLPDTENLRSSCGACANY